MNRCGRVTGAQQQQARLLLALRQSNQQQQHTGSLKIVELTGRRTEESGSPFSPCLAVLSLWLVSGRWRCCYLPLRKDTPVRTASLRTPPHSAFRLLFPWGVAREPAGVAGRCSLGSDGTVSSEGYAMPFMTTTTMEQVHW